jgi:hypothetical protein
MFGPLKQRRTHVLSLSHIPGSCRHGNKQASPIQPTPPTTGLCRRRNTGGALAGAAHDRDHEDARRALLSGEVLSLRQVLDIVAREYPGEPVEVEFERDDGIYLYELKVLQPSGRIVKMKVDAASGKIISVKARNGKKEDD